MSAESQPSWRLCGGLTPLGWFKYFLLVAVIAGLPHTRGFQCHSCAYSYTQEDPNADDACVFYPEVFTGNQRLKCENNCVVREIYNQRLDKVVGFQRSCTEHVDDGHCTGDPLYGLVTCVYTCTGELCNSWVRGQLHTLFPANGNNRGTRTLQSRSSVHMIAIISVLLYISRLLEQ